MKRKRHTLRYKKVVTSTGSLEKWSDFKFSPLQSGLEVYDILAVIFYMPLEIKGYKKTKDSRDEIHETHSGMQFIRPQEK
jgi:hypothetical protein